MSFKRGLVYTGSLGKEAYVDGKIRPLNAKAGGTGPDGSAGCTAGLWALRDGRRGGGQPCKVTSISAYR